MNFTAVLRKEQGTSASRRLRRENKVPGIVYGNNVDATLIALDHNEIYYDLQKEKFHASILTMQLDGKDELVVLRAFQMHPYKPQVLHCDFQRIDPNSEVTMRVPLHFFGSISHSHPYSGIFQHRNVISSIPESHRLFAGNSEISQYFFHSDTLVSPNRHDIGKQRIPAGSLTFR